MGGSRGSAPQVRLQMPPTIYEAFRLPEKLHRLESFFAGTTLFALGRFLTHETPVKWFRFDQVGVQLLGTPCIYSIEKFLE